MSHGTTLSNMHYTWPPTQELQIEHSIESLKVQLANDAISPRLADAKAILQSILWSLSPHRGYKEMTAALARQAVHVAVKISALIETTPNEMPQPVKHCLAQFEETLRDIQYLIQFATQSSTLYDCSKFLPSILAMYTVLEEQLGTLLVHSEQYIINLQSVDSVLASYSRIPSLHNGDVLRSGEMFSNAHDLTINGGYYYSGQILIQQPPSQESTDIMRGIVQGTRVIAFEDISVSHEIYTNRGYRLHSDNTSGKARVVKVYQGPQAKERCLEAAKFHQTVMHPSFLHMIGVSPINSKVPFLVFNGELAGSLEASIAAALKKDVRNSLMLGLQTVIGLSSGLDYLRDVNYDFISAGLQHFGVFLTVQGTVLISFDPYIVRQNTGADGHEEQGSSSEVDKCLFVFHELCKQTFDAACQIHYDGLHIERAYDDILENGDRFEDVDDNSSLDNENHDSSNPSRSVHQTVLDSAMPSIQRPRKRPTSNGHRRELVWKSESVQNSSLKDILHEFKTFLDGLSTSSGLDLYRRRGRYTARTAHRCPGYNRTEITLTPNINRSAIVSHSTPLPREICPVCKQVVKDAEIFNCICGEDDESVPTIQCSTCYEWHHRPCVAGFEFTDQCFTCPDCTPSEVSCTETPILEAALIEALEKYEPEFRTQGDQMRNRFISDYIYETTGKLMTSREVDSHFQQLRDTCKEKRILQLISRHYTPEDQIRASVTPPDSPTTSQIIYVQISLQKELRPCPVPKIHFFENDVTNPHTIKLSPRPDVNSKIRASNYSLLSYLSGTVEFPSPYALVPQSTFLVYLDDNITPIHSEVAPLKCLSSLQPYGWQYSSEIAPDFWDTLCFSPDSMRYTILQYLKIIESYQTVFIIYRFDSHPPFGPVPILGPSIS